MSNTAIWLCSAVKSLPDTCPIGQIYVDVLIMKNTNNAKYGIDGFQLAFWISMCSTHPRLRSILVTTNPCFDNSLSTISIFPAVKA